MRYLFSCFFTMLFLFTVCSYPLKAQTNKRVDPYAPGENIYKHYTGRIGNRPVVLDLIWGYQGASNFGGSYYYFTDSPGTYHFYIQQPATFDHDARMHANVVSDENPFNDERQEFSNADITWDFEIAGQELKGVYRNRSTGEELPIDLIETYGKPIAFDMVIGSELARIPKNDGSHISSEIFTLGITPSPLTTNITEMDFINKQLLKFVQTEEIQSEYIADFYKAYRVNFIKGAKIYFNSLFASGNAIDEKSAEYRENLDRSLFLLPVYNDTGFLVVRKNFRSGDRHEVSYLNLDLDSTRVLQLGDIININHTALSPMLEHAFRKKYKLGPAGSLSQWLITDRVPVSTDFRLGHKGIIFNYNKAALLRDIREPHWNPELSVYLSYEALRGLLRPEFAARLWP